MKNKELNILLSAPRGFCAGVERAIEIVEKSIQKYGAPVYVRHEIVHNKFVVDDLKKKGAVFIEELEDSQDIPAIKNERPGDFLDGFLQGTRSALTEGGRQNMTITMRRFDERRLGALVALFERAVGLYGELVNVNAYHQPGVEAGKKAAADILDLQQRVEEVLQDGLPRTVSEIRQVLDDGSDESIFWIMRHLTGNKRHYSAQGDWSSPAGMRFSKGQ